jgi:hypothetical protein
MTDDNFSLLIKQLASIKAVVWISALTSMASVVLAVVAITGFHFGR